MFPADPRIQKAFRSLAVLALFGVQACQKPAAPKPETAAPKVAAVASEDTRPVEGSLHGVLRQIGNVPFVEVVITGHSEAFGKGDYHLVGPKAKEIANLPLGPIHAKGMLRHLEAKLAGTSGKTRRWLEVDVSEYSR